VHVLRVGVGTHDNDSTLDIFKRELRHLLELGFIERKPDTGVRGLEAQVKAHGSVDVKAHFSITPQEEEYVALRHAYEEQEN